MGTRSYSVAAAFLLVVLVGCRAEQEPASRVQPTKIEVEAAPAVQRGLDCQRSWNEHDLDALAGCFAEPFSYTDNLGAKGSTLAEFTASREAQRATRPDRIRKPLAVIGDGEQVFSLWVEKGTFTGTLEGQTIAGKGYAVLGASFWTGLDRNGAFHTVSVYEDPNMLLQQVGEADRASHGPVPIPETPVVLERDDAAAKAAIDVVRRRVKATNDHDLEALAKTYAEDVVGVVSSNANDARQRAGVMAGVPRGWAAYPNVRVEIGQIWGAGDYVVLEGTFAGTNTGDLGSGVGATKKSFEQPFVELLEISNGEIKRFWRVVDSLAVARQVGLLD